MEISVAIIFSLLILFLLVAIRTKRAIKYNGKQERAKKPPLHIFTLNNGDGTSFPSAHRMILGFREVSSRRRKFKQPVISKPLWIIGLTTFFLFISFFY